VPTTTTRIAGLLGLAGALLLTGCARPGELGTEPEPTPPAATTATPTPINAAPPGPLVLGAGTLQDRVTIRTTEPAVFSVRTVTVPPGGEIPWHQHPGTEMSIVTSGAVTVVREGACEPVVYQAGETVYIADEVPHTARNEGTVPLQLVVTYLLTAGAPERSTTEPACPSE
jgi:quercetin dioxygenase-like cupin family protein